MKHLTTLAVLLATTSLAFAASDNESFIVQSGKKNEAIVGQKKGNNTQGTAQFGNGNYAVTAQKTTGGSDTNTSATVEIGNKNTSQVGQLGNDNSQATLQVGNKNTAETLQNNTTTNKNASFIGQFGNGNNAFAGQGDNGASTQATLQFGVGKNANNYASTTQITDPNGGQNNSGTIQVGADNTTFVNQTSGGGTVGKKPGAGGDNNQFSLAVGTDNASVVNQNSIGSGKGTNAVSGVENDAATLQFGNGNYAQTTQKGTNPGDAANQTAIGSLILQFNPSSDPGNSALVKQVNGNNLQATVQGGSGNYAQTTQKSQTDGTEQNGSLTVQLNPSSDAGNTAFVKQTNGNNLQATLQAGSGNFSQTTQKNTAAGTDANGSLTVQLNPSSDAGNTAFAKQTNGNNLQATLQAGSGNYAQTTQKNTTAGTDANGSLIVQLNPGSDAGNTALVKQTNGNNLQGTVQAGSGDFAQTTQKNSGSKKGKNNSLDLQFGNNNSAITSQKIADPLNSSNGSLIAQVGNKNSAMVHQNDTGVQAMIGANLQATVQVGNGNSATTTQTASAGIANTSVTAQFGSHNIAVTTQK
jgi:hypothetical protein